MGSLTVIGLACDLIGATILLGPEYRPVRQVIARLDPVHRSISHGLETFYREATTVEDGIQKTDGKMSAGRWRFLFARYFLNKRIEGQITSDDTMSLGGVGIRCNGEYIKLPEEHHGTVLTDTLSTTVVSDWLDELLERRMYRIGGILLVGGFALQLVDQLI